MFGNVVIAANINDAKFLVKNKSSYQQILALTPNVESYLKSKRIKLFNNHNFHYDELHKKTIIMTNNIDELVSDNLQKLEISDSSKEFIKFQINVFMSSYIFLYLKISNFKKIEIIINDELKIFDKIDNIIELIFKKFFENNSFNHYFPIYDNYEIKNKFLISLSNNLVKFFIKNKKVIFSSGEDYGMSMLNNKLLKIDKNHAILKIKTLNKHYYLTILRNLKNYFISKNLYDLFSIIYNNKKYNNNINFIFDNIDNKLLLLSKNLLFKILVDGVNYIENSNLYFGDYFTNIKINNYFAHQIKMANSLITAQTSKNKNSVIFLISHGIHSSSKNNITEKSLKSNATGMLYSQFSKYSICQSKISFKALIDSKSHNTPIKSFPLMWGKKSFTDDSKSAFILRNKKIILHASTFKSYYVRPWIYESPFEYINGLNKLIESVKKLKDIILIVRVRPTPECTFDALKSLIIKSTNVIIKKDGSFIDDLKKASLLISYSSTTIEEALYERIPVAIHGYSSRFNHFEDLVNVKSTKRSPIYHLDNKKLSLDIKKIFDLHFNKPLQNNELDDFIWNDTEVDLKTIKDFKKFK